MRIGEMNDLNGGFTTRRGTLFGWLSGGKFQVIGTDVWKVAETNECRAESFGRVGPDVYVSKGVVHTRNFTPYDPGADIWILSLAVANQDLSSSADFFTPSQTYMTDITDADQDILQKVFSESGN